MSTKHRNVKLKETPPAAPERQPVMTREQAIEAAAVVMHLPGVEWMDQTKIRVTPWVDALIAIGVLEVTQ